jgi:hypothetical protein
VTTVAILQDGTTNVSGGLITIDKVVRISEGFCHFLSHIFTLNVLAFRDGHFEFLIVSANLHFTGKIK